MITTGNRHGTAVVTLPPDREILITSQFDAPADLVFRAWTTPDLVRRFSGCDATEWLVCEIDLRPGGAWRYVTRQPDGAEYGFHGVDREVEAPHRLVSTEADGVTTTTVTVLHVTSEARDGHIASGMETGLQVTLDRLEDVVRALAA